jgi:protein required for attachment to host cells
MQSNLGIKLIAVLDINTLKLYQARGLKITREIGKYHIHSDINHRPEKHEGTFHRGSGPSSSFDPHTAPKDIEYQESSRAAEEFIEAGIVSDSEYNELIIVADPKMLGFIKQDLNSKLKKIIKVRQIVTREIKKDLVNHDIEAIEKAVFA